MEITIKGEALIKPENMTIKEELAWRYYDFNADYGWKALLTGGDEVVITDESDNLENGTVFPSEDDFMDWLNEQATTMLNEDAVSFLESSGAVLGLLLSANVVEAVINEINLYG